MKTAKWKWFLFLAVVALLASYMTFTKMRTGHLEARIERLEAERRETKGQAVGYVFDESFIKYFGDQGVAEVERAMKILEQPQPKRSDSL
jgi:hypothetical protein